MEKNLSHYIRREYEKLDSKEQQRNFMEKFHEIYGFYPKYPVADAGYGSFHNYLFCQAHGMEKFMKFPMYKKETTDEKYHEDPFRAVNFKADPEGNLICIDVLKNLKMDYAHHLLILCVWCVQYKV